MDALTKGNHRNFFGGFTGGMLGLLGLAYFGAAAMALGCLVGVVLGFWHREIWSEFRKLDAETGNDLYLRDLWEGLKVVFWRIPLEVAGDALVGAWRPVRWWRAHPLNAAKVIKVVNTVLVCLLWVAGTIAIMQPLIHSEVLFFAVSVLMSTGLVIGVLMPRLTRVETLRTFYGEWERIARLGQLRFALWHFGYLIKAGLAFTLSTLTTCITLAAWAIIFVIGVLLPLWSLASFLRTFWWASTRRSHWPCAAVTLAVTAATGSLASSLLAHDLLRWAVALVNGFLCGFAAEGVVMAMARWHDRSQWYRAYAHVPLKKRLAYYAELWFEPARTILDRLPMLRPVSQEERC